VLITESSRLASACSELRQTQTIYVDTEFVGEGRYFPALGAIQIAADDRVLLIDPLAVSDLTPLFDLLLDPAIEKVLHAGYQDLSIFYNMIGNPVAPIFDVQIAASLLGYEEEISLGKLVSRTTKRRLKKSHAFTDWLRRPLTDKQVEYALEDVRCLQPVHVHLVRELVARKRLKWAREEFQSLENASRFTPEDPREMYRRIRGVERLKGEELARLREVVAWRECTARQQNIPPRRICMDPVLLELARRPRSSTAALSEVRGLTAGQIRKFGQGLIEALAKGAAEHPPEVEKPIALPQDMLPTVDFLVLCLRSLASDIQVSSGRVANRNDLRALVLEGPRAKIPLMRGWRREAIGEMLLATLQGRATARISPDTQRVHIEWTEEAEG